jgi:phosphoribosylformimino-5-aminoimidazole carboxamide ribotide isomerase
VPTTNAGGIRHTDDLELLRDKGQGRLDFTVGSALDIFGGTMMTYRQAVAFRGQPLPY